MMTTITGKVIKRQAVMQTLEVQHLKKNFYQVKDDKVNRMAHVQKRRCFICGCRFEIGDWVSLAFIEGGEGNKCLCETCVDDFDPYEEGKTK